MINALLRCLFNFYEGCNNIRKMQSDLTDGEHFVKKLQPNAVVTASVHHQQNTQQANWPKLCLGHPGLRGQAGQPGGLVPLDQRDCLYEKNKAHHFSDPGC